MKKLLLALVVALLPVEAGAAARYSSPSLSCAQVHRIVRSQGSAVMRWTSTDGKRLPLYVRVVDNRFQCDHHEFAGTGVVPTKDDANCPVRVCKSRRQFAPFDPFGYNILN